MLSYLLIRLFTFPLIFLSYRNLHKLGRFLGAIAYHLIPKFRKRALCNLSLTNLNLNEKELRKVAKESIQNLMITCLEYAKFDYEKNIAKVAYCDNPEEANTYIEKGKGVIFFCGHQSNWEILFLEGTSRMPGTAIGRPIKNIYLYNWILRIRQKFGGKIITPKTAVKEGLRALKRGSFLGIVGDQGMPDSGFCCPFLGKLAWTSPLPALLAYRTECPLIVATTTRIKGKYKIHYSDPILPNPAASLEEEVDRMMKEALGIFEKSVRKSPGEWLWIHNRWKQQVPGRLKRKFRHESIAIVLDHDYKKMLPYLKVFREIYPTEFITLFVPKDCMAIEDFEVIYYKKLEEVLKSPKHFKLVFNFSENKEISKHFKKQSAFRVSTLKDLKEEDENLGEVLKSAILA